MTLLRHVVLSALVLVFAYGASISAQNAVVSGSNESYTAPASAVPQKDPGYIGMQLSVRTADYALMVDRVAPGSKAEFAGLQTGDIVKMVEGQAVHSMCDVYHAMRGKGAGDVILVRVNRNGEDQDLKVVVSSTAEMQAQTQQTSTLPQSTEQYTSACDRLEREYYNNPILGVYVNSTGSATLTGTIPNTGAERASLVAGDVIENVNGTSVPSFQDLKGVISAHRPGDQVTVVYRRAGVQHTAIATLNSYADVNPEMVAKLKAECVKASADNFVAGERISTMELSPATLSLAPNPSTGEVNLTVAGLDPIEFRITVNDLLGNNFFDRSVRNTATSFSTKIDMSGAPRGVYLVSVIQGNQSFKQKLIIE